MITLLAMLIEAIWKRDYMTDLYIGTIIIDLSLIFSITIIIMN